MRHSMKNALTSLNVDLSLVNLEEWKFMVIANPDEEQVRIIASALSTSPELHSSTQACHVVLLWLGGFSFHIST